MRVPHECTKCAERTGYPHYFRSARQLKAHMKDMHAVKKPRKRKPIAQEIKAVVLKRDGKRCVQCRSRLNLHVHHKVHREHGGTDEVDNLETLCDLCHAEKHRGEPVYNIMVKSFWKQMSI